jgi:FkbM family methyltransferase
MATFQSGWSRISQAFRGLRFSRAVRVILVDAVRSLFDRPRRSAYGQLGDDLLIEALLGSSVTGCYVDVGCNHPIQFSNTWRLYCAGWRGLVIDANPALIERFRRERPRDTAVCAAVSERVERAAFTISRHTEVSTLAAGAIAVEDQREVLELTTETLDRLLRAHAIPPEFELLTVDIEGFDHAALRGLDWSVYRPKVVIVEMHGFVAADPAAHPTYALLTGHGYRMAAFNMLNGFFVRKT